MPPRSLHPFCPLSAALLVLALPLSAQSHQATSKSQSGKATNSVSAAAVHSSAIVVDTHADTTQRMLDENFDMAGPLNGGHVNFDAIKKGNLSAEFFSIWVEPELNKGHYARRTLELIDAVLEQAAKHPDKMKMTYSAEEIEAAHSKGIFASLMGIEGGHSIEDSLGLLRDYYRLGVRYMTLTWSNSNGWADSSGDASRTDVPHTEDGLSPFGVSVVHEMNRLGMMVDISHVSDKTFYKTIEVTQAPLIASHSSARALCDAPRNMTDDMLRAMKKNGGVVMVNFYPAFISNEYAQAYKAQAPERNKAVAEFKAKREAEGKPATYNEISAVERQWTSKIPRPPFSVLIDHIDHVAKVAGIDHVGLGSDFDGISATPQGIDSVADLPKITAALMERGYSAEDCRKILGGNFLRVFKQVEQVGKQMQVQAKATSSAN